MQQIKSKTKIKALNFFYIAIFLKSVHDYLRFFTCRDIMSEVVCKIYTQREKKNERDREREIFRYKCKISKLRVTR